MASPREGRKNSRRRVIESGQINAVVAEYEEIGISSPKYLSVVGIYRFQVLVSSNAKGTGVLSAQNYILNVM